MRPVQLTWGRAIYLLVLSLVTLQVFHMFLLNRLETNSNALTEIQSREDLQRTSRDVLTQIRNSFSAGPVIDSSGSYRIVYNAFNAQHHVEDNFTHSNFGVTLATHCSVNHLHHLLLLARRWQGPISVAVFVSSLQDPALTSTLVLLRHCIPNTTRNISVHLVIPLSPETLDDNIDEPVISSQPINCQDLSSPRTKARNYQVIDHKYPNNLLRNIARRKVSSRYVLVSDIDMVPSDDLHRHFIDFSRRSSFKDEASSNTVYVLPSFEVHDDFSPPGDKKSLLRLWEEGYLRPFYQELCSKCQRPTDYRAWRNLTSSKGLSVGYTVTWTDPWEPFYIGAVEGLPEYDERFKQYGFNRISQVCETHIAGYNFAVLDNAFLVHQGLKTRENFHSTKDVEQEENRLLFRQFKEGLKVKYPDVERRC